MGLFNKEEYGVSDMIRDAIEFEDALEERLKQQVLGERVLPFQKCQRKGCNCLAQDHNPDTIEGACGCGNCKGFVE